MPRQPSRPLALLEALLVSMVWGSSFIFVKIALTELGPLTIGGLRYFLGFACLLPFLRRRSFALTRTQWLRMALLGFSAYTLANGALFWALQFLSATTGSFLMSLITVTVLLGGVFWLREVPNRLQAIGILIVLGGMVLFFSPGLKPGEPLGLAIFALALLGFTLFGLLSRIAAIDRQVDTLTLTAFPLAIGGGYFWQLPSLSKEFPTHLPRPGDGSVTSRHKHGPGQRTLQSRLAIFAGLRDECATQPDAYLDSIVGFDIAR